MARPSKSHQFTIYEDPATQGTANSHSSNKSCGSSHGSATSPVQSLEAGTLGTENHVGHAQDEALKSTHVLDDIKETAEMATTSMESTDTEVDDPPMRRQSTTSISSFPESAFETDQDISVQPAYSPYSIRPSFRRPLPFERSPRRSALHAKSRNGTPRSVRSNAKGSPLPRRMQEESVEDEKKEYPLVLLHVSLLPISLRWSKDAMHDILPPKTYDKLQLLQAKVSENILHRGILIPHPREEYELLEERLLEALELKKERVTKCGHYRSRHSTSSASSTEGSEHSGDSALGSSIEGSAANLCSTCYHHVKDSDVRTSNGQKWSIKVFAANGLMRASAWAAAWPEMERVDVEILPWIDEDLRRQLDARMSDEEVEERLRREDEEVRIREVVEEQVRIAHEEMLRVHEEEQQRATAEARDRHGAFQQLQIRSAEGQDHAPNAPVERPQPLPTPRDLPQVYRKKDVPLSLLLKNYVYLLARDKRNIFLAIISVFTLWLCLRAAILPSQPDNNLAQSPCEHFQPATTSLPDETANNIVLAATPSSVENSPAIDDVLLSSASNAFQPSPGMHDQVEISQEMELESKTAEERLKHEAVFEDAPNEPPLVSAMDPELLFELSEDQESCENWLLPSTFFQRLYPISDAF